MKSIVYALAAGFCMLAGSLLICGILLIADPPAHWSPATLSFSLMVSGGTSLVIFLGWLIAGKIVGRASKG